MSDAKNPLLAAAREYAARGWPVFPLYEPVEGGCSCGDAACEKAGKHPRTVHGFKDATTDEATIRRWWSVWPAANIGIATGKVSGLVVLDIDPQHGGEETLAALEEREGKLPDTVQALTGGGGLHDLFAYPEGGVKSRVGIAPGCDVRSDGSYIVAPPSLHPSGKRYEWGCSSMPGDVPLAEMPPWLKALAGRPSRNGDRPEPTSPPRIPEGQRNSRLTSLAGAMRRRGATEDSIYAALRSENTSRCDPPLDEDEVATIARSVAQYPPAAVAGPRRRSEPAEITVTGRHGADLLDEAWAAIAARNEPPTLFRHVAWPLARVQDGALRAVSKDEFLGTYVERSARWVKIVPAGDTFVRKPACFPTRLLGALHATAPESVPLIERLIPIPAFVGDALALHDAPGFDSETANFFHGASVGIGELPSEPTPDDLEAGRQVLDQWFQEFRFANVASRAHALALLITLLVRHAIDGPTPLFLVEAAQSGTGKSCLVENIFLAAHGAVPETSGLSKDEEEIRKQVLSWVLGKQPVVYLDNLHSITGARSATLSPLITGGGFRDRVMREHIIAGGAWHGILVATANNPDVEVEMVRRTVRVRVECPVEDPWLRRFDRIDPADWTLQHRREIVRAVAVAVQAWRRAGCPQGGRVRPSFGAWSQILGGILHYVGPDLAEAFLSEDDLAEAMIYGRGADDFRQFANAWADRTAQGKAEFTASELVGLAQAADALPAAIVAALRGGEPSPRALATRMAQYLIKVRGRVVQVEDRQWRVTAREGRRKSLVWALQPTGETP